VHAGGLAVGGAVAAQLSTVSVYGLDSLPSTLPAMVAGGALVGYGTSRGSGCTSGHGICGLSRVSKRSAAAVGAFMTSAFVTATTVDAVPALRKVFRSDKWMLNSAMHPPPAHGRGAAAAAPDTLHFNMASANTVLSSNEMLGDSELDALTAIATTQDLSAMAAQMPFFPAVVTVGALGTMFWIKSAVEKASVPSEDRQSALGAAQGSGLLFAAGLAISGMSNPTKVLSFVTFPSGMEGAVTAWDPSLPWVMAGAICMAFPFFQLVPKRLALPALAPAWHLPTVTAIDSPLVRGSLLFGAGWGLAGICPGPGLMLATTGALAPMAWLAAMLAGMRLEMWANSPRLGGASCDPTSAVGAKALPALPAAPPSTGVARVGVMRDTGHPPPHSMPEAHTPNTYK
jgi:uncharacterized membrane protein YedE/YeeE